ncbi:MAG: hypothetical protein IIW83_02495 [Clostridia bacterium]|nr:hypothetical protein [Clostridia bacterium]
MTNTTYNYYEAIKEDLREFINEGIAWDEFSLDSDYDELYEAIYDAAFIADSVTGNASGSYWFSTYKAEEALLHNLDLLADACEEFGGEYDVLKSGAEACDVTIRCYLLGQVLPTVLSEFKAA